MKKSKKIVASMISTMMILSCILSSTASSAFETEEIISIQPENKISDELIELMAESQTETYPVVIWMKESDISKIEENIEEAVGFSLDSLDVEYSVPADELIQELAKAADGDSTEYLNLLM